MFTVIIVVCSLKSMCILSFVLIGCCMSELHGHLCRPYRNVWPEAVYCCFIYKNYIVYQTFNMTLRWSSWSSISVQSFISLLCTVFEIRELKLKKKKKNNNNNNNNNKEKMKNCENELLQF